MSIGVTGDFSKRKKKRKQPDPAYQELMADASKRLVDCVIVWKFDRFARSLSVLITALEHFNKLGVEFISYTQSIDTTTPMGRFFYNIIGSFADFEKELIVEHVNSGPANARAKGVRLGRPERDPSAGKRVLALRQQGLTMREIAAKERMSAAGVLKILRRYESAVSKDEPESLQSKTPEAVEPTPQKPVLKLLPAIGKAKSSDKALQDKLEIYQFKMIILGVSPLIWRRVQIRSDCTLTDLSDAIVAAFDWGGYHLHKFFLPHGWGDELPESGESKQLNDLGLKPDDCIMYQYQCDFGDLWEHEIVFEKAVRFDKSRDYPTCTAGQNAGPPEDCGGPGAYMNAKNFLSRRKGKKAKAPRGRISAFEKDFYMENYRGFDPDRFDRAEVNEQLAEFFKGK